MITIALKRVGTLQNSGPDVLHASGRCLHQQARFAIIEPHPLKSQVASQLKQAPTDLSPR